MKNNTKNLQEMGMLSLSNLTICIKKAEFSTEKDTPVLLANLQ